MVNVNIDTPSTHVPAGYTLALKAKGIYSDSSVNDLTAAMTWLCEDASIANISNADGSGGILTAYSLGTVTINAYYQGIKAEVE